jgi:peptide/nickel transport system substrate-binding protein
MRGILIAVWLLLTLGATAAEEPKRGGILTYMIPADGGPSLDGHKEATYAVLHATAPF